MDRKRKRDIEVWLDESDVSSDSFDDFDDTDIDPDFRVDIDNSKLV